MKKKFKTKNGVEVLIEIAPSRTLNADVFKGGGRTSDVDISLKTLKDNKVVHSVINIDPSDLVNQVKAAEDIAERIEKDSVTLPENPWETLAEMGYREN